MSKKLCEIRLRQSLPGIQKSLVIRKIQSFDFFARYFIYITPWICSSIHSGRQFVKNSSQTGAKDRL